MTTEHQSTETTIADMFRRHLRPSLKMFRVALENCPDSVWEARDLGMPFWAHAYHTLSSVDFWLRDPEAEFSFPPYHSEDAAFMREGDDPPISREQMEEYRAHVYAKVDALLEGLETDGLLVEAEFFGRPFALGDRLISQVRHVQHHTGFMNAILRLHGATTSPWVGFNED